LYELIYGIKGLTGFILLLSKGSGVRHFERSEKIFGILIRIKNHLVEVL
jgi:hypothetical protein